MKSFKLSFENTFAPFKAYHSLHLSNLSSSKVEITCLTRVIALLAWSYQGTF